MRLTRRELKPAQKAVMEVARRTYFDAIPLADLLEAAQSHGVVFDADEIPFLLCGREGQAIIPAVNAPAALWFSWYKMPSGRYEVIAYLS